MRTSKPKLIKWQKKTNFGPNFGLFTPYLGPENFLWVLPLLVARNFSKLSSYAV